MGDAFLRSSRPWPLLEGSFSSCDGRRCVLRDPALETPIASCRMDESVPSLGTDPRRWSCRLVRLLRSAIAIPSSVKTSRTPRMVMTAMAHFGKPSPDDVELFCRDPAVDWGSCEVVAERDVDMAVESADAADRLARTLLGGDVCTARNVFCATCPPSSRSPLGTTTKKYSHVRFLPTCNSCASLLPCHQSSSGKIAHIPCSFGNPVQFRATCSESA